jgi:hypothetical protein
MAWADCKQHLSTSELKVYEKTKTSAKQTSGLQDHAHRYRSPTSSSSLSGSVSNAPSGSKATEEAPATGSPQCFRPYGLA